MDFKMGLPTPERKGVDLESNVTILRTDTDVE